MADLRKNGVTHVIFSIDVEEQVHDKWRKHSGLFARIMDAIEKVKTAGLKPQISIVVKDKPSPAFVKTLTEIAEELYALPNNAGTKEKLSLLSIDRANIFSNFIDIGNGIDISTSKLKISDIPAKELRCKAFYRPSPNLRINANGALAVCPLLNAGEGFGNVHEKHITELLNNMQNSFSYKLHSLGIINNYLKYWDENIYGKGYEHLCSVRAVLSILAKKMHEQGLDSNSSKLKVVDLIKETAIECGYIKQ